MVIEPDFSLLQLDAPSQQTIVTGKGTSFEQMFQTFIKEKGYVLPLVEAKTAETQTLALPVVPPVGEFS